MFNNAKIGDIVLVQRTGDKVSIYNRSVHFLVPIKIKKTTPKQFITEDDCRWSKNDGASIPLGYECTLYNKSADQSAELEKHNTLVKVVRDIKSKLSDLQDFKVSLETQNPHTISKQLDVLLSLFKEAGDER
jgi:hypothetical protein